MPTKTSRKIRLIGAVLGKFPKLITPQPDDSVYSGGKYYCTLLINKKNFDKCVWQSDGENKLHSFRDAIKRVVDETRGNENIGVVPYINDGDDDRDNPRGEEYLKGHFFIRPKCSKDRPPVIVNQNNEEFNALSDWKPETGDLVNAVISAYSIDPKGLWKICFGLNAIKIVSKNYMEIKDVDSVAAHTDNFMEDITSMPSPDYLRESDKCSSSNDIKSKAFEF